MVQIILFTLITYFPSETCNRVIDQIRRAKIIDQATFSLEYHASELDPEEFDHASLVLLGRTFGAKQDFHASLKQKLKLLELIDKIGRR